MIQICGRHKHYICRSLLSYYHPVRVKDYLRSSQSPSCFFTLKIFHKIKVRKYFIKYFFTLRRRVVCQESSLEMESYCFTTSVKASTSWFSISWVRDLISLASLESVKAGYWSSYLVRAWVAFRLSENRVESRK